MSQEKIKENYMELQHMEQQMKQIQQQVQAVEMQISEIENTRNSIDDFKKVKKETDIMVPVSNGIFAKAKLTDNSEFLVNVGANTMVKKDIEETKELMANQMIELQNVAQKMRLDFNKIAEEATKKQEELQKMIEQDQKK